MKRITTVDWFAQQLAKIGVTDEIIGHLISEAKQMEKEQVLEDYSVGYSNGQVDSNKTANRYYNEIYDKNN